ncbi:MAG: hypothetical protein U9M89_00280 [Patescibacteria group bacterium]|nr:hypothetical protein [Patescibacteria group bacterium]
MEKSLMDIGEHTIAHRRCILQVTPQALVAIIKHPSQSFSVENGLPKDTRVISSIYNHVLDLFEIVLESEYFPELIPGDPIPNIDTQPSIVKHDNTETNTQDEYSTKVKKLKDLRNGDEFYLTDETKDKYVVIKFVPNPRRFSFLCESCPKKNVILCRPCNSRSNDKLVYMDTETPVFILIRKIPTRLGKIRSGDTFRIPGEKYRYVRITNTTPSEDIVCIPLHYLWEGMCNKPLTSFDRGTEITNVQTKEDTALEYGILGMGMSLSEYMKKVESLDQNPRLV